MAAGVSVFVERFAENRVLARLLVESPAHPTLSKKRRTALANFADSMVQMTTETVRGPTSPEEGRRMGNIAIMLVGGFNELLTHWVETGRTSSPEEISGDVLALFEAAIADIERP